MQCGTLSESASSSPLQACTSEGGIDGPESNGGGGGGTKPDASKGGGGGATSKASLFTTSCSSETARKSAELMFCCSLRLPAGDVCTSSVSMAEDGAAEGLTAGLGFTARPTEPGRFLRVNACLAATAARLGARLDLATGGRAGVFDADMPGSFGMMVLARKTLLISLTGAYEG
jgi:hypothetical protein